MGASLATSQGYINAFPEGLLQQLVHLFGCMDEPAVGFWYKSKTLLTRK